MDDFMDTIDPRIERDVHRTKTGVHRRVRMDRYMQTGLALTITIAGLVAIVIWA